ncbi:MAG: hypothetical protein Fur005_14670 [Roseiflexaceae bacterium]
MAGAWRCILPHEPASICVLLREPATEESLQVEERFLAALGMTEVERGTPLLNGAA